MAATPFFPPLSDRGRMASTVSGSWEPIEEKDFLLQLARGLTRHMPENTSLSTVRALPDVWGQLVAFQAAWLDAGHPLAKGATGEWRGILALLALSEWRKQPLHIVDVDLREVMESPFQDSSSDPNVPNLASVIEAFMPRHEREPLGKWEIKQISILLHGENLEEAQTLAVLVPSTLLMPSRTYSLKQELAGIPWVAKSGYPLLDPVEHIKSRREREALAEYLMQLRNNVGKWDLTGQPVRRSLVAQTLGRLDAFVRDLIKGARQDREQGSEYAFKEIVSTNNPLWYEAAPLFNVPKRDDGSESDTKLLVRPELRGARMAGAVLYGNSLKLYKGGDELVVWGDFLLSELLSDGQYLKQVEREAAQSDLVVLNADALLMPVLLQVLEVNRTNIHPACHPGEWGHFLLPVDPRLLAFMSIAEIFKRLAIDRTRGGCTVILTLPLTRRDGSVYDVSIRRDYTGKSLVQVGLPADITLWPNFRTDDWRHYYIEALDYPPASGNTARDVKITGTVSAPVVSEFLAAGGSGNLLKYLTHGLDDNREFCQRLLESSSPEGARTLRLMDRPPEALILSDGERRGLIALGWNEPSPVVGDWGMAVDFGASGTLIQMREPGQGNSVSPQPNRWRLDILQHEWKQTAQELAPPAGKLPSDATDWPALSMLYDNSSMSQRGDLSDQLRAYEQLVPLAGKAVETLWNWLASGREAPALLFGLKYGQRIGLGANFTPASRLFLKTMLLGAAAEVVGNGGRLDAIRWKAAHPANMFASEVAALKDSLHRAIASVESSPLRKLPPKQELRATLELFSENRAFVESLVHSKEMRNVSIIFDVGGFSADISIWKDGAVRWSGSLALAGHDIFNDYFAARALRIDDIVPNESGKLNNAIKVMRSSTKISADDPIERGLVEIHLRQNAISSALAKLRPETVTGGLVRLRNIVRFAHAAFLDYLHVLLGKLNLLEELSSGIYLYYGGRGGLLIQTFLEEEIVKEDAQKYLYRGNNAKWIKIEFSSRPKYEVADGLLRMSGRQQQEAQSYILPMGERFTLETSSGGKQQRECDDVVGVSDISMILNEIDLTRCRKFVDEFANITPDPANIARSSDFECDVNTDFLAEIERAKNAIQQQTASQQEARDASLQPLFILAIRALIRKWHKLD